MFSLAQSSFAADAAIVSSGIIGLFVFLILKIAIFRFINPDNILKFLVSIFLISAIINIITGLVLFKSLGVAFTVLCLFLSLLIFGLLSFLYVVCIFGPYQTSIRIRLLKELYRAHPRPLSFQEITQRYSPHDILQIRLKRLVKSGELSFDGTFYRTRRFCNVFSLIDLLSGILRKIYKQEIRSLG